MQRKGNPCELLLVLNIGTATMKNSMQVVQKIKNRTMMRPSIPTSCYLSEEIQNTNLKKKNVSLCSLWHYLQWPGYGSNLSVMVLIYNGILLSHKKE